MARRMLDLPYFTEAWQPETWVPMVPGCECDPDPWRDYDPDIIGRVCVRCKEAIRLVPNDREAA